MKNKEEELIEKIKKDLGNKKYNDLLLKAKTNIEEESVKPDMHRHLENLDVNYRDVVSNGIIGGLMTTMGLTLNVEPGFPEAAKLVTAFGTGILTISLVNYIADKIRYKNSKKYIMDAMKSKCDLNGTYCSGEDLNSIYSVACDNVVDEMKLY